MAAPNFESKFKKFQSLIGGFALGQVFLEVKGN